MPGRYTEDDLDGGSADVQVTFALDGQQYEIDLNHRNADALRLRRVQEHTLHLGNLPSGKWRYLTDKELQDLKGSDGVE